PAGAAAFARTVALHLRAAAARYPDDPELTGLVRELRSGSRAFAELWAAHEVTPPPALRKTFDHPVVGVITVNCDVLDIADQDQRVVIYTAAPGSPAEEALRLLSVIGTQRLDNESGARI
ncbi:MmyB family transcriptional regulator, partial [Streptomyces sp. NPDC002920]